MTAFVASGIDVLGTQSATYGNSPYGEHAYGMTEALFHSSGLDVLDTGQTVITVEAGLRAGPSVLCGVNRCGLGSVYATVPASLLFDPEQPDRLAA